MNKETDRRRKAAKAAREGVAGGQLAEDGKAIKDAGTLASAAEAEDDVFTSEAEAEQRALAEAGRQARLDTFGAALSNKRKTAVEGRQSSGIETIWREDEEFYEGIDDANRHETVTLKPRDPNGAGGTSVVDKGEVTGSTVFVPITRPYVDFSAGRAADMLLPTDDPNWDLRETPMPDIIAQMTNPKPIELPGALPGAPATIGEAAAQMVAEAQRKVEKAKTRIKDWLEEGQYNAELRKVLKDAAKVGVGILKGPFPSKRISRAVTRKGGKTKLTVQKKTAPESRCISYWNFFPDPGCGDDIHRGSYVWERDRITARQLRDLMGTVDSDGVPMYIEATIKRCLEEGPQRKFDGDSSYYAKDSENFEVWYYHGVATAEDLQAAGVDAEPGEVLPVMVTMVNDRVIKAALTTLDSGEFPYDVMVWQERESHWAGIGVARQVRAAQRIVNGAVRNLMDNAGLAAGPQIVLMKGILRPMGKNSPYEIRPRKLWELDKDGNVDDVRKAFAAIDIPMLSAELLSIVQFGLKVAEDCTGMPMLMQGQQGNASTTVGGMTILTNNSNTPLRAIAKLFDDRVTVPHLMRYYEWLLMYGPDEDEKGEFILAARGSSALFERDAQNQAIMAMAPFVKDPDFKLKPDNWIKEWLKAQRLDPARFQYSDAEWKQVQQNMTQNPPPADPRLEAAKISADARLEAAKISAGVQSEKVKRDADRDAIFAANEAERTRVDGEARREELQAKIQLAMLDYANQQKISLEAAKTQLSDTAMKLQVQKELSAASSALDLHKHHNPAPQIVTPPTEPAGRAAAGEAYQA